MRYLGGIDGGQTSTAAAIVDERGVVVGRGSAGPCDDVGQAADSTRLAEQTALALEAALREASLGETVLDAVVLGLSGFEGTIHGAAPQLPTPHLRVVHDAPVALAGALGGEPGVIVISGTGSAAYGEDATRRTARAGGWGYIFGDAGSSFALARDALAAVMTASDRGEPNDLAEAALAFFDEPDLRALARSVYTGRIERSQVAAFGRVVGDAARFGRADAVRAIERAAEALAELAASVAARLSFEGAVPLALAGGSFGSELLRSSTERRIAELLPNVALTPPRYEPALGAALLAFDAAGIARPPDLREAEG